MERPVGHFHAARTPFTKAAGKRNRVDGFESHPLRHKALFINELGDYLRRHSRSHLRGIDYRGGLPFSLPITLPLILRVEGQIPAGQQTLPASKHMLPPKLLIQQLHTAQPRWGNVLYSKQGQPYPRTRTIQTYLVGRGFLSWVRPLCRFPPSRSHAPQCGNVIIGQMTPFA